MSLNIAKQTILTALTGLHAHKVEVSYNGSGDSGQVEDVTVTDEADTPLPIDQVNVTIPKSRHVWKGEGFECVTESETVSLGEALKDFVYEWLEVNQPGWELNEGSTGTLTIDLAEQQWRFNHCSYYTESYTEEISL